MEQKQQPPYPLRMPQELREELEREAEIGKRSLNAEVVMRLELTLARQEERRSELVARLRAVSRQFLELGAQLMVSEEIQLAREARLNEQRSRDPSEINLAPLHAAAEQAEQVVHGFKQLQADLRERVSKIEAEIGEIDERAQAKSKRGVIARKPAK